MSKQRNYDLTEGGIFKKLLLVAVPIMGTSLMQMAYNLTDMFWLGQGLGSDAVAASGMGGMYLWLSMALLMVGRLGAEIGVSQSIGRKDLDAARGYAHSALFLATVLGLGYGLLLLLGSGPLIAVFGILPEDVLIAQDASVYLAIVGIGIPFSFVSAAITGTFNGAGNSRLSFRANAIGLLVNMVLDPLLIVNAGWGIAGAAIATILAQAVVCALFLVFVKRHKARPFPSFLFFRRPDWAKAKQILRWSAPTSLESGLFTMLAMVTTRIVTVFGGDALAVMRVGSQIESLSWLVGGGFGTAVTSFVGQNYGARKWGRIHRGFRISMKAMLVYGGVITVALFFGGRLLYSAFVREQQILEMGAVYLRILACCQLLACVEAVAAGAFRGLGKTVPPAVTSIVSNVLRVPLAYALTSTSLGLNGVWWAITLTAMLRGILVYAWYARQTRSLPKKDMEHDAQQPALTGAASEKGPAL